MVSSYSLGGAQYAPGVMPASGRGGNRILNCASFSISHSPVSSIAIKPQAKSSNEGWFRTVVIHACLERSSVKPNDARQTSRISVVLDIIMRERKGWRIAWAVDRKPFSSAKRATAAFFCGAMGSTPHTKPPPVTGLRQHSPALIVGTAIDFFYGFSLIGARPQICRSKAAVRRVLRRKILKIP